ncbi:tetratricopeptide repeat protein [Roseibacterium sp. SDUM158016]|jgi:Flp pilus assembly protein TadD|uniref:tetratricopeptide repeat protein n=1 Tax=Roseicyclus sediminis TaxID=2980997 RepID=UPI0021D0601C|nr:tetratricopeptide repeat protein [Roseibacterium sp. SDUM158016]MCU4655190.1 tetratricopeptide repeat protein [Roseibacterium sp. SDUM158016]
MRHAPAAASIARRICVALAVLAVATACTPSAPLTSSDPDLPGLDTGGTSVDGLIVGHRLMESGEYELALRAYYRAAGTLGLNVDVLSALGSANLRLGRIGQAEALLRQALDEEEDFVPALNNLGVVLMEQGEYGEARRVFQQAFALDSGRTDAIRENLRTAIARMEDSVYSTENNDFRFDLIRRGPGVYELLARSG